MGIPGINNYSDNNCKENKASGEKKKEESYCEHLLWLTEVRILGKSTVHEFVHLQSTADSTFQYLWLARRWLLIVVFHITISFSASNSQWLAVTLKDGSRGYQGQLK